MAKPSTASSTINWMGDHAKAILSMCGLIVCLLSVSAGWSAAQESVDTSKRLEAMLIGSLKDPGKAGLLEIVRSDSKEIATIKALLDKVREEARVAHVEIHSAITKLDAK